MANHIDALTRNASSNLTRRVALVSIICITLLGWYLRYRCLGCLGFRWDEDLTALAVKALLDKGVPELPSGMIYLRFYPYQWLVAASVNIFGFSEFSMRLPAVLFGTALVPAAYLVAKKLFNEQIGLVVAACIAFSFWQVEMARTARMYAPFFLTYLIAAYSIYRAYFQDPDRVLSPWVLPLAFLALTIHQLAYSLAILVLLAIPLRKSLTRTASLLLQAGGIGIAFLAVKSVEEHYFDIPRRAAESASALSVGNDSGLLASVLQQISFPDIALLSQVFRAFPAWTIACLAIVMLLSVPMLRSAWRQGYSYRALVLLALCMSVTHQFNLVGLTLALMLISLKGGINQVRNPAWYLPVFYCLSILFFWLATIISVQINMDIAMSDQGFRKLLRALFDYPNFRLFWSFLLERPLLAVPLALGTCWGIDRIARDRPDPVALFVTGGFWLVLFANGVLETKFEFFRYALHIDPFFLMLVVAGLFATPMLFAKLGLSYSQRLQSFSAKGVFIILVAAISIAGVNPAKAFLTSARDYSETAFPFPFLGLDEYEDFATPAAYVREHMQDNDLILVLDPREFWNYIGRVDYWIRSTNYEEQTYLDAGRAHDRYLGIPLLHSEDEVSAVVAAHNGANVWILLSRARLAQTPAISSGLKSYLSSLDDSIVYVGRDQQTVVMRIGNQPALD